MAEEMRKLSEEELYQCLKSLNVPVRLSDLKTPTKELMIRVFECCLKDLHVDVANLNLRPFQSIQHLDHADQFEDTQTLMLLVVGINFITNQDGLVISVKDIIDPKPKRTKKILNYLIIFWNAYLRKIANFQAIEDGLQEEKKRGEDLARRNEMLQEKCIDISVTLDKLRPEKAELQSCTRSKGDKLAEQDKQKNELAEEYQILKKRENDLRSHVSAAEVRIVSTKEQINELDQLILSSPEKLDKDLKKLKDLIKDEEIKIREKELELKEKKKSNDANIMAQGDNMKTLNVLNEMEKGLKELCDTLKSISLESHRNQEEKDKMQKLQSELRKKEQIESMHVQKSSAFQLSTKKKKETFAETIEQLKGNIAKEKMQINILETANLEIDQKCENTLKSVKEIVNTCKQAEALTEEKDAEFAEDMQAILSSFQSDCEEFRNDVTRRFAS